MKITNGHYRIEKNGTIYDIEKLTDDFFPERGWDLFATNKDDDNDHEFSNRYDSKKQAIEAIGNK